MKNLLAFLLGWLIAAVFMIPHARASVTVIPDVPGYTATSAGFTPSVGQLKGWAAGSFDASTMGYSGTGHVSVGGKPLTIPAKVPLASTAGNIVKNAMRVTPMGLAGTLAAGWLLDQGMEWAEDHWQVSEPIPPGNSYPFDQTWGHMDTAVSECYGSASLCSVEASVIAPVKHYYADSANHTVEYVGPQSYCTGGRLYRVRFTSAYGNSTDQNTCPTGNPAPSGTRPATQEDWDNLPDPSPVVGPELPTAPYMPNGAPVGTPQYTSGRYNVGEPYQAADGSTKQTVAQVTNNNDNRVTITTNETTIINAAGEPVADPVPEPSETEMSECEKNPNAIGCAEFGTADSVEVPTVEVPVNPTVTPIGGPGQCPADVVSPVFGITWSYQPVCDFAADIRPLIIGFAWLAFAYIVAGTIRT